MFKSKLAITYLVLSKKHQKTLKHKMISNVIPLLINKLLSAKKSLDTNNTKYTFENAI